MPAPLIALLLSGFASLTYQVVWVRRFAVALGTTNAAITLVLAMFLGGLGLGAVLAGRSGSRLGVARLARRFLFLEVGAAGFAAALPFYRDASLPLLRALPSPESAFAVSAALAALFLLPAATLMGATLPTLTALVRKVGAGGEGRTAGWLYAANTLGALLGSVAAARLLLPWLGLTGASLVGIAANLAAGVLLWRRFGRPAAKDAASPGDPAGGSGPASSSAGLGAGAANADRSRRMLRFGVVAACSGFAALAAEIGWARLAALLFGPTIYTFACVVAAVILGVALGSGAAGWLLGRRRARHSPHFPPSWLAAVALAGAAASASVAALGDRLVLPIGELVARHADDVPRLLDLQFLGTVAVLLLPALAFGATFPLAVAAASGHGQAAGRATETAGRATANAGRATGAIYGWTAGGNVLGAFAAGAVVIPSLGIEAALFAAILAQLAAAVLARPRVLTALAAAAVLAGGAGAARSWDWEFLSGGLYKAAPTLETARQRDFLRRGRLRFLDQGAGATVSVKEVAGELSLSIDGKVDATDGADMLTQRMLAHLPLLLAPRPESVLIVGHGSGVTAGAALRHPVSRVTAAEISPEVARASRLFEASNGAPWRDERFSLLEGDARNHLLLTDETFEVVISEPSNPWMSGVSPLFTVEFFALVRSRLREGGLFCQWLHLYNLDGESLRSLVGGFTDVFPEAALFVLHDGDALLLGSRGDFPAAARDAIGGRIASLPEIAPYGLTDFVSLRRWLTAATPELSAWAAGAPRHRDDHPILEFRAPFAVHAVTASGNRRALEALGTAPGPGPSFGSFGPAPPEDAGAHARRARGLLLAANPAWALELAGRALELDPERAVEAEAAETLARAALSGGEAAEGERLLRRALSAVARDGEADSGLRVALARLLLRTRQLDEAAAALESGPPGLAGDPEALLLAAEIQVERGAADSAEALVLAALARNPRDAEAAAWLAELSLRRGNAAEAAARAAAILTERPETARALRVRAVALAELGDGEAARQAFAELLRRAPEPSIHWGNAGAFERAAGRYSEAVRLYREAVDRDPGNRTAYRGLLEAAEGAGDREQVRRAREVLGALPGE